jgi:hypothetical protein
VILDLIFSRLVTSLMTTSSRNAPVADILAIFVAMIIRVIYADSAEIAAAASTRNRLGISSFYLLCGSLRRQNTKHFS